MPGELLSLLNHCPQLHTVMLQCCLNVDRAGLLALVCKPGMRKVVVRPVAGLEECCLEVQQVAGHLDVSLRLHDTLEQCFYNQPEADLAGSSDED